MKTKKSKNTKKKTFVYDEKTPIYYVDIPQIDREEWINVESFTSRKEAIKFAKEKFGADDEGKVSIVTG